MCVCVRQHPRNLLCFISCTFNRVADVPGGKIWLAGGGIKAANSQSKSVHALELGSGWAKTMPVPYAIDGGCPDGYVEAPTLAPAPAAPSGNGSTVLAVVGKTKVAAIGPAVASVGTGANQTADLGQAQPDDPVPEFACRPPEPCAPCKPLFGLKPMAPRLPAPWMHALVRKRAGWGATIPTMCCVQLCACAKKKRCDPMSCAVQICSCRCFCSHTITLGRRNRCPVGVQATRRRVPRRRKEKLGDFPPQPRQHHRH